MPMDGRGDGNFHPPTDEMLSWNVAVGWGYICFMRIIKNAILTMDVVVEINDKHFSIYQNTAVTISTDNRFSI